MQETKVSKPSPAAIIAVLAILVVAHAALAIWYASATPWRTAGVVAINPSLEKDIGAPDERQHANYIVRLARGEGFPVLDPKDPNLYENYQAHQPPAYYVVGLGWSRAMGVDFGPGFDDHQTGMKMRALNAVIGSLTVVGVFFMALWGFGRPDVGLVSAGFAALLPMFVGLSSAVSNDPMLICLCTWALAFMSKGIQSGWSIKLAILVGGLAGLALLTKTTAAALLPVLLLAALLPQKKRPSLAMAGALLFTFAVVAGPWLVRNTQQYGDPLAIQAFNESFTKSAQKELILDIIASKGEASGELAYWKDWVGWWTVRSFIGVFGYMDIWLNETGRPLAEGDRNILYRLCMVGLVIALLGWILASLKPELRSRWQVQAVNIAFALMILALFVRFNMQYFQAQGRYLLPALGPIACGVGIGVTFLVRQRWQLSLGIVAGALLIVNLYAISILPDSFRQRIEAGKQNLDT